MTEIVVTVRLKILVGWKLLMLRKNWFSKKKINSSMTIFLSRTLDEVACMDAIIGKGNYFIKLRKFRHSE